MWHPRLFKFYHHYHNRSAPRVLAVNHAVCLLTKGGFYANLQGACIHSRNDYMCIPSFVSGNNLLRPQSAPRPTSHHNRKRRPSSNRSNNRNPKNQLRLLPKNPPNQRVVNRLLRLNGRSTATRSKPSVPLSVLKPRP